MITVEEISEIAKIIQENNGDDSVIEIVEYLYSYFVVKHPKLNKAGFFNTCGFILRM